LNPEEESEFDTTEQISWMEMVKREAKTMDFVNLGIGSFCGILVGAALPGFSLVFGNMIDDVAVTTDDDSFNSLQKQALWMIYIGAGLFFVGAGQIATLARFGETIGYKT